VYVFEVAKQATKKDIKRAIEKSFRVKVLAVNTAVCSKPGRRTKVGVAKPRQWKKAMVKLQAGEKISLFEGA
jgi:large subunit ribosomal protein L23